MDSGDAMVEILAEMQQDKWFSFPLKIQMLISSRNDGHDYDSKRIRIARKGNAGR